MNISPAVRLHWLLFLVPWLPAQALHAQEPEAAMEETAEAAGEESMGESPIHRIERPATHRKSTVTGARPVTLAAALELNPLEERRLSTRFEELYGATPDFNVLAVEARHKPGTIIRGAVIEETDDDILLDRTPCTQDLAAIQKPYKKEKREVQACGGKKLEVVLVEKQ
jgi:hypothetical protein